MGCRIAWRFALVAVFVLCWVAVTGGPGLADCGAEACGCGEGECECPNATCPNNCGGEGCVCGEHCAEENCEHYTLCAGADTCKNIGCKAGTGCTTVGCPNLLCKNFEHDEDKPCYEEGEDTPRNCWATGEYGCDGEDCTFDALPRCGTYCPHGMTFPCGGNHPSCSCDAPCGGLVHACMDEYDCPLVPWHPCGDEPDICGTVHICGSDEWGFCEGAPYNCFSGCCAPCPPSLDPDPCPCVFWACSMFTCYWQCICQNY